MEGIGRSLTFQMAIPFPVGDELREEAVGYLHDAQRRLRSNDVDGAMLEGRRALEFLRTSSGWGWPENKKPKEERTADERWSLVRSALEEQAGGALHKDAGTKGHVYSRIEAETLIAATTALLRLPNVLKETE